MTDFTARISDALALTALLYLPGAAWVWTFRPASRAEAAAIALLASLIAALIPVLLLAEAGHLTAGAMWTCAIAVFATGAFAGRCAGIRAALPGALLLLTGMTLLLMLPRRGEWLAGGWDPGVNLNMGLFLSRTGTLHPPPDSAYGALDAAVRPFFARLAGAFLEAFPGWPMEPDTGAYRPYFYRGTPALIAAIDLAAGPTAALRTPLLLGFWSFIPLFTLLRKEFGAHPALLGVLIAAAQPMLLHHLHIPASEMLELFLISALGLLIAAEPNRPNALLVTGVVGLAIVNRISFLFFAPVLVLFAAMRGIGLPAGDPHRWRTRALAAALVLGGLWYAFFNPSATVKVAHLLPQLRLLVGGVFLAVAAAEIASGRLRPLPASAPVAMVFLLLAAWLAREYARSLPFVELAENANAWLRYIGWPIALIAAFGWVLWTRRAGVWNSWHAMLLLGLWVVLLHKHAAHLYPWSLKRWLPFSIPLLAFGAAGFAEFCKARYGWRGLAGAAATLLMAVLWLFPAARDAWRHTEFDGLPAALAGVASEIHPTDIVVADHFRWGFPLAAAFGKPTLNGEPLWSRTRDSAASPAAAALARLAADGRRILLFTSTARGAAIFSPPLNSARLLRAWPPIALQEIQHHRRTRSFPVRSTERTFALYEWAPQS